MSGVLHGGGLMDTPFSFLLFLMLGMIYLTLKQYKCNNPWSPSLPLSEGTVLLATGTSRRFHITRAAPNIPGLSFCSVKHSPPPCVVLVFLSGHPLSEWPSVEGPRTLADSQSWPGAEETVTILGRLPATMASKEEGEKRVLERVRGP